MCLAVYIASDQELPLVTWNEKLPAFNVLPVTKEDKGVQSQFSLPLVVYAGSHEGCGCGFFKEGEVGEELQTRQQNYYDLVEYIKPALEAGFKVEIFSCWEGDQRAKLDYDLQVSTNEISSSSFQFKERALYHVSL